MASQRHLIAILFALGILVGAAPSFATCTASTALTCGATVTGTIGPNSCQDNFFFPTNRYVFTGTANLVVSLSAIADQAVSVSIVVRNDAGVSIGSTTDDPASFSVTLPEDGRYFVDISFANPHVTGNYRARMTCAQAPPPPPPPLPPCAYLGSMTCGSHVADSLQSTGCLFTGTSQRYAIYKFPGIVGQVVDFTARTSAFSPALLLYRAGSPNSIAHDTSPSASMSTLEYKFTDSADYEIVLTDKLASMTGGFTIDASCKITPPPPPPTCGAPLIQEQPLSTGAPPGGTASLHVTATGDEPLSFQWYAGTYPDTSRPFGPNSPSVAITNVRANATVWVHVSNGCGYANSSTATVQLRPAKARAVRH